MADRPQEEIDPVVVEIMKLLEGRHPDLISDALAVALMRHVKAEYDVPRLDSPDAFVDTTLADSVLGAMEVRLAIFRKIPPVDKKRYTD